MLNRDDIELLMEALDALKSQDGTTSLMSMMLGTMLADSKEQAAQRIEEVKREMDVSREKQRCLEERIILVKAELIRMRDRVDIESVLSE